jgi:pimeloyl-ACP methyl ester carboxylesterase
VVLAEYRGYGVSRAAGKPSEPAFYRDAEAVLDALQAQGIGADRTVVMGISLGTGVAAEMARRGRSAALVLVSPYTSITAMAKRVAPFLPASFICPDAFDTLSKARDIRVPALVVHGDQDEVISVTMGRAVAAAIPGAELKILAGGHHNDLFVYWHRPLIDAIVLTASR